VIAQVELRGWLSTKGLPETMMEAGNKGGTLEAAGVRVTFTDANHSSGSFESGTFSYLGEACGFVVDADGTKLYFAGDTNVFASMQLIGRIYRPDVAILPIGDHFTMSPTEAAVALELLDVRRCVPCHYGTFPMLTGTPEQLRELAPGVEVLAPEPGETITL
jgi:L-ascorbate metabolism protein UlaG (beta-lactamase superfamily)